MNLQFKVSLNGMRKIVNPTFHGDVALEMDNWCGQYSVYDYEITSIEEAWFETLADANNFIDKFGIFPCLKIIEESDGRCTNLKKK